MRTRPLAAVVLAAVSVLLLAVSPALGRSPRRQAGCRFAGSTTIMQTAKLRVFRTRRHYDPNYSVGAHVDTVYACWRPTGRRTVVDTETPDGYGTERFYRLKRAPGSDHIVAYLKQLSSRGGRADLLESLDVRRGRVIHSNGSDFARYQSGAVNLSISEFIVTRLGSLGWIGGGNCPAIQQSSPAGVYAIGFSGGERRLQCGDPADESGKVIYHGLRSTGTTLSWRGPTGAMSAPLS